MSSEAIVGPAGLLYSLKAGWSNLKKFLEIVPWLHKTIQKHPNPDFVKANQVFLNEFYIWRKSCTCAMAKGKKFGGSEA